MATVNTQGGAKVYLVSGDFLSTSKEEVELWEL